MGTNINLEKRFLTTLEKAARLLGKSPQELRRDEYVRITVDHDIPDRLNKVELNDLGGWGIAKKLYVPTALDGPKILVMDIETFPIEAYVWGIWQQNIGLNQIKQDWTVLSWAAKWVGTNEVFYMDQRNAENIRDDKELIKEMWELLDEADIVVGQNSKAFDIKKLNARFLAHGMKPPSSFKQVDTKILAKRHFGFTSNKLEYMTETFCLSKKTHHKQYPGFELWKACLNGDIKAFKECEKYNIDDVLSTEELYTKLIPWDSSFSNSVYSNGDSHICSCGCDSFRNAGYYYTQVGKYKKYCCKSCGSEYRDAENLLDKSKRKSIKRRTVR